jgi:hypothetical protein
MACDLGVDGISLELVVHYVVSGSAGVEVAGGVGYCSQVVAYPCGQARSGAGRAAGRLVRSVRSRR